MSTEENIRASVALKAAVDFCDVSVEWSVVTDCADYFLAWLENKADVQEAGTIPAPTHAVNGDTEPSWGCPICGTAPMKLRSGRNGEFYGCKRFPDCKGTRERDGSTPLHVRAKTTS